MISGLLNETRPRLGQRQFGSIRHSPWVIEPMRFGRSRAVACLAYVELLGAPVRRVQLLSLRLRLRFGDQFVDPLHEEARILAGVPFPRQVKRSGVRQSHGARGLQVTARRYPRVSRYVQREYRA